MPPKASASQDNVSAEGLDYFQLPKTLLTRIVKSVLPADAKVQKEAIGALGDSATVFINYLAATAQDVAATRSHKTIAAPDILKALEIIELGDLVPLLTEELEVYRAVMKSDKAKAKAGDTKGKEKAPKILSQAQNVPDTPRGLQGAEGEDGGEEADNPEDVEDGGDEDEENVEPEPEEEEELEDDYAEEVEEIVDNMAIEEEELRKDQRGLDDHVQINAED